LGDELISTGIGEYEYMDVNAWQLVKALSPIYVTDAGTDSVFNL
jgi:hypothetical protein